MNAFSSLISSEFMSGLLVELNMLKLGCKLMENCKVLSRGCHRRGALENWKAEYVAKVCVLMNPHDSSTLTV